MSFAPAIMAVAAAASTAIAIKQQNQQVSAAEQAALNEYGNTIQQQEIQARQIQEAKGQEISERAKQALRERSKLRVISGESGLQGATIDRLKNEISFKEGYDVAILEQNLQNQMTQSYFERQASYAKSQSELNVAASKYTSGVGAGLQIGLSGVGGYAAGGGFSGSSSTTTTKG